MTSSNDFYFIDPKKIKVMDLEQIGGKAMGLLWLLKNDFAVPDFRVISDQLSECIYAEPSTSQQLAIIEEFVSKLDPYWFDHVSVRSSALDEDGESSSFAGIHESFLNISTQEGLVKAIYEVIMSARSDRAFAYRTEKKLDTKSIRIAVIIQKMIAAEYAGVAFAMNPVSGNAREVWVSSTSGLGDKLVSGEVAGDEFVINDKNEMRKLSGDGEGIQSFIADVAKTCRKISMLKGKLQDIEWAFASNQLWLLQTRDITSFAHFASKDTYLFDNSNIQESYCGVTTPLTFSYASKAYEHVYAQLMRLMRMSSQAIVAAEWRHRHLLGLVEGRVYYNINYWYEGLKYLPHFGRRKAEMEEMMGIEEPVDFVKNIEVQTSEKLKKIPQMLSLLIHLSIKFAQLPRLVQFFDKWFWDLYKSADLQEIVKYTDSEILEKIAFYQKASLEHWGIPLLNDFRVMMMMGKVKRRLKKINLEHEVKSFIYGAEIESVKPTIELHRLAQLLNQDQESLSLLFSNKDSMFFNKLQIINPLLFHELRNYIYLYGDRCMGELKLETITLKQNPEFLLVLLRNYIHSGVVLKEHVFSGHGQISDKVSSEAKQKMGFMHFYMFKKDVDKLKKAIAARELMRFHRTRSFGMMREFYLELGKRWTQSHILTHHRDIFYLTVDEIFDYGFGKSYIKNLKPLIEIRKKEERAYQQISVHSQVEIKFPLGTMNKVQRERAPLRPELSGLGCSPGIYEGEVVFVQNALDVVDLKDKILLAERTDPGWTPLFALIKGVIIERGSVLSHSAVIAREMGIPAVVGVQHITQKLVTGDRVKIDGSNGTIEIIRRAAKNDSTNFITEREQKI